VPSGLFLLLSRLEFTAFVPGTAVVVVCFMCGGCFQGPTRQIISPGYSNLTPGETVSRCSIQHQTGPCQWHCYLDLCWYWIQELLSEGTIVLSPQCVWMVLQTGAVR
jgi:hypothetical protein